MEILQQEHSTMYQRAVKLLTRNWAPFAAQIKCTCAGPNSPQRDAVIYALGGKRADIKAVGTHPDAFGADTVAVGYILGHSLLKRQLDRAVGSVTVDAVKYTRQGIVNAEIT